MKNRIKKVIITLMGCVSCIYSFAQTNIFPPNGNVGIGTNTPALGFLTIAAPDKNTISAIAIRQSNAITVGFDFGLDQLVDGSGYIYAVNGSQKVDLMKFDRNNYTVSFNGGNVGIGTSNPTEKLSVKGNIRAKEIRVENGNWPDYVFSKNYTLPTLEQTEKHIKEKGHLSGIPSAEEVKSNGIDLGEMNAKLLQKIEELTLYLIEKDKEINQLKKLSDRVTKLESKK